MKNKEFEKFLKTGSIIDYLKYKAKEREDDINRRNNRKNDKL